MKKISQKKSYFFKLRTRAHSATSSLHVEVNLDDINEGVFGDLSSVKLLESPGPLSTLSSLGGSPCVQPTPKEWGIVLCLPEGSVFTNQLDFFCTRDLGLLCSLFIFSIICWYQYRLGIFSFTFGFNLIIYFYVMFQFWTTWTLSLAHWFLCIFDIAIFFFTTSLLSGIVRWYRLLFTISFSVNRTHHFSKDARSLLLENGIRKQDLDIWWACCCWGVLASPVFSRENKKNVWKYRCPYTHL